MGVILILISKNLKEVRILNKIDMIREEILAEKEFIFQYENGILLRNLINC